MEPGTTYRHTQPGTVILAFFVPAVILLALLALDPVMPAAVRIFTVALAAVIALVAWLFSSLTVTVDEGAVEVRFGPGPFRKRWPLSDFVSVGVVRNKWWYGWGIRLVPRGWLYNVSGLDAVELTRRSGRVLRIGTDDAAALADALRRAIPA